MDILYLLLMIYVEVTMNFLIHFELVDGTEDSIQVSGETIKEIQEKANTEIKKRDGKNSWSEELT